MLVINPDECISCGVCEYECPAKAIVPYYKNKATEDDDKWLEINIKYSKEWHVITSDMPPPDDADQWDRQKGYDGPDKTDLIDPTPGERQ